MMTKRKMLFLGITVVAVLAMVHFGAAMASAYEPKGVFKCAIHFAVSSDWVDPSTAGSSTTGQFPLYFFHDALMKPMQDGTYTPCLATSWSNTPDYKVWDFTLRKGVKFHNGDEMTAEDVVFTFRRYKSNSATFLKKRIEKLEAVNPYLFRVTFNVPFPNFLEYFLPGLSTIGWIVPKKHIEKVGDAAYKRHPIGAGPYKFVENKAGMRIIGEAFNGFWRKVPHIKRQEYYTIKEKSTRYAKVKTGEVDHSIVLNREFTDQVKNDPKFRVVFRRSPTHWLVYMAQQWDPKSPWSDVRVRKAASLALDKQMLADVIFPGGKPVGTISLTDDPWSADIPPDPYDPKRAKELMVEAGYAKGFDGGNFYPFAGYWDFGEMVTNYWKKIGINMKTILLERPAWYAQRKGGKFKGGTFIDTAGSPLISTRLAYLFGGTHCYGNYPDIEALWDKYNKTIEIKDRKDLMMQIQKLIHEKRMYLPTCDTYGARIIGPRVKGNITQIQGKGLYPVWFPSPMEDIELKE